MLIEVEVKTSPQVSRKGTEPDLSGDLESVGMRRATQGRRMVLNAWSTGQGLLGALGVGSRQSCR